MSNETSDSSTVGNPYAPSACDDGRFGPESPFAFWFAVTVVAGFCLLLTLISTQTFVYGVEGLLVLVLSIGRVPMMRQQGNQHLLITSSAMLLLSSLLVVTLVMIATLISFFALYLAMNSDPEITGRDQTWGMLLGGGAAMLAFVYFFRQSKRLPF